MLSLDISHSAMEHVPACVYGKQCLSIPGNRNSINSNGKGVYIKMYQANLIMRKAQGSNQYARIMRKYYSERWDQNDKPVSVTVTDPEIL